MSIEQNIKQILQPYKQNVEEYSKIINHILLEKFPDIDKNYSPNIDSVYEALCAKADILKTAKKEFEAKQNQIKIPGDVTIDYWMWQASLHKELWDGIYADKITGENDKWHVCLFQYHKHIHTISQVFDMIPGSIVKDETHIHFERKTPSIESIATGKKRHRLIKFQNGTYDYDFDSCTGKFIAKCAPKSKITTELKNINGSKILDIDTVHFNISELGSGALDAILYDIGVQNPSP